MRGGGEGAGAGATSTSPKFDLFFNKNAQIFSVFVRISENLKLIIVGKV